MRRIPLTTIAFRLAAIWIAALALALSAMTIHVAKTGNDANVGNAASPYLTIGKAAQVAQAGDSIIVHAGEYREWVQPARGGSSESTRITYKAAPGEIVQIKGSERVTNWVSQGNGVWRADLDDAFFGGYNPFSYDIQGKYTGEGSQYINGGAWCHLGEVYLDGQILYNEKQTLAEVQTSPQSWYTSRAGTTSSIYANFGAANPNTQLAEVNVREGVFGNAGVTSGINYITVDGFHLSQSADAWCPPYRGTPRVSFAVLFACGTNWQIRNCKIKYAKMRGICLDGGSVNNLVRDNVITECGVAGVAGSGYNGTTLSGNWISDIHMSRPYYGDEHGCIKANSSGNVTICGNVLRRMNSPAWGNAIYFDYCYTGNRVTGNLIMECSMMDVALGTPQSSPIALIDHNVMIGGTPGDVWTGAVYAHNLFYAGGMGPAATNNLVLNDNVAQVLTYSADTAAKTVTINFTLGSATVNQNYPIVTTASLGTINGKQVLNRDGTPVALNYDMLNTCRNPSAKIGPFQDITTGINTFVFRPNNNFLDKVACTPLDTNAVRVDSFTVSPTAVLPGGAATLAWAVKKATSVSINNGVTASGTTGSAVVNPAQTTVYTLTAQGPGGPVTRNITGTVMQLRDPENPSPASNGINYKYYTGNWQNVPNFSTLTPTSTGTLTNFAATITGGLTDYYCLYFQGYIEAPSDGIYTFYTSSDDASMLWIGNQLIVNNDGPHAAIERNGQIALKAGKHAISLGYVELAGGQSILVSWQNTAGGIAKQAVPANRLFVSGNPSGAVLRGDSAPSSLRARFIRTGIGVRIEINTPAPERSTVRIIGMNGRTAGASFVVTNGRAVAHFTSVQSVFCQGVYMCEVRMPNGNIQKMPIIILN